MHRSSINKNQILVARKVDTQHEDLMETSPKMIINFTEKLVLEGEL